MTVRRISFTRAKATYVNRFTAEHVPGWATRAQPDGRFYAPHYATDAEWFNNTAFPGEPGSTHGDDSYSTGQTWPHGKWLGAPFVPGQPVVPWVEPTAAAARAAEMTPASGALVTVNREALQRLIEIANRAANLIGLDEFASDEMRDVADSLSDSAKTAEKTAEW